MKNPAFILVWLLLAAVCQAVEYTTVDDFESYVDDVNHTDLQAVWTETKRTLGVYLRRTVGEEAEDSNQSMRLFYSLKASPYYAEAYRTAPFADFTDGGLAKAISLWYRSASWSSMITTLDFGDVYVTLQDNSGGDTDTVRLSEGGEDPCLDMEWHEWNIDLQDFNNPALDITDINRITLGVGDGTYIGLSYLYFDEIRLYPARCLPHLLKPEGGINNDCVVDFEDVEIMSRDWLDSDFNTIGCDGILSESFATSSTGWVNDPNRGRVLEFEGAYDSNDWVDIEDYALPNFQNRTIAVWVKNNGDQVNEYCTNIFSSHSDYKIELSIGASGDREGRLEGGLEDCNMMRVTNSTLDVNEWHHAALVIGNPESGDPNYVYCQLYCQLILDGVRIADNEHLGGAGSSPVCGSPRHERGRLRGANVGSYNDGDSSFINATLDNFRIYDYNMPVQDVNELYMLERDGSTDSYKEPNLIIWYKFDELSGDIAEDSGRDKDTNIYRPLYSAANIIEKDPPGGPYDPNNSDIVNFVDYAALADNWLVEKLWPEP